MPAKKYKYAYRKTITLADGKRHDICANTKEEFEEKLLEVQLLTKQGIVPTDITVAEFAKVWYKTYKDGANLRLNSKASIKNTVNNHILPYIGELRIDSVKPLHIQRIMNEANKLSNSTSSKVLAAMRSIFNAAVDNNLIAKSPVGITLKAGGTPTPKKSTLDKEECERVLAEVKNPRAHIFALIGLRTGMRRGEIVALHWADVDFEHHIIHVCHNAVMPDGQPTIITDDLKTTAGERDIGMPADLENALLDWRKKSRSKYVVSMHNGKPLTKSAFRSMWRIVARTVSNKHFTAHIMRHTYVTQLVESGVDLSLVQYLAGHSDDRMTKKVYLHRNKQVLADDAAQAAREAFGSTL